MLRVWTVAKWMVPKDGYTHRAQHHGKRQRDQQGQGQGDGKEKKKGDTVGDVNVVNLTENTRLKK